MKLCFHYHPILGLQYFSSKDENVIIDLAQIPTMNFSVEKWIKTLKETGMAICNSMPNNMKIKIIIHNLLEL
jgi:hypothetical protein